MEKMTYQSIGIEDETLRETVSTGAQSLKKILEVLYMRDLCFTPERRGKDANRWVEKCGREEGMARTRVPCETKSW